MSQECRLRLVGHVRKLRLVGDDVGHLKKRPSRGGDGWDAWEAQPAKQLRRICFLSAATLSSIRRRHSGIDIPESLRFNFQRIFRTSLAVDNSGVKDGPKPHGAIDPSSLQLMHDASLPSDRQTFDWNPPDTRQALLAMESQTLEFQDSSKSLVIGRASAQRGRH